MIENGRLSMQELEGSVDGSPDPWTLYEHIAFIVKKKTNRYVCNDLHAKGAGLVFVCVNAWLLFFKYGIQRYLIMIWFSFSGRLSAIKIIGRYLLT